nr:transposase (putative), gypsy type [Tanacetum cinerariifolium]
MLTQQDIYAAGSGNRHLMLNKYNYVPWSSRIIRYARSRPNGKMIVDSIENGPYELTENDIMLNKYNYVSWSSRIIRYARSRQIGKMIVDSIENEPYVRKMIATPGEPDLLVLVQTLRNRRRRQSCSMNEKSLLLLMGNRSNLIIIVSCNLWKRHVTIVRQTKNIHEADFTQIYEFLKMNQDEVNELRAERLAKTHDPLALMAYSQNSYNFTVTHNDQSSSSTHSQQSFPINNKYNLQPSLNQNFMQPPMTSLKDINDPTEAMNATLILFAKAFKLTAPTNNQRTSSNPRNRQIAQPGIANQNGTGNIVAAMAEGDLDEIEDFNANCILMANLKHASTSGTQYDKAPVYDTDGSAEVQLNDKCYNNEIFNMFTQEEQYTYLLDPIPEPQLVPQNDNHVTYVAPSMVQSGGTVETSFAPNEETRARQETVYCNLVDQVAQVNMVNCNMRETNAKLKSDLARYKIQEQRIEIRRQFLDKEVDLEAKIKDLENILLKWDQMVQTMHMLNPNPNSFYHPDQKIALGYPNLSYLNKAQLKQQSLYNGNLLLEEHDPLVVYDLEETLELAQKSREKMRFLKKEIKPANYAKINHLSGISYDKDYNDMQQKVERLQAQLRDLNVVNYEREISHLKTTYKNLFDSITSNRAHAKLHNLIYENAKLRAWLFENTSESMNNTSGTSVTPQVDKPKLIVVTPCFKKLHASTPSHSVPQPREFNVVKHSNVIAPEMFKIDPSQTSRVDLVPNNQSSASIRTNPITNVQRHVTSKENVSSDMVNASSTGLVHTARTRRPHHKGNTRNARVPFASKSSEVKKNVTVEDHHRILLLSKNQKTMSSECNNIKLAIRNNKSEIVCGCSKHMTGNIKLLINFVWKFLGTVRFENDHIAAILGYGDLKWGNITITRVYIIKGDDGNPFRANIKQALGRPGRNTPQCYTKPLDSLKNWNNRFFWVNKRVFSTVVDWRTNAPKDGMPAEGTYSIEAVRVLDTHRTPIQKHPEMLLCLVGISRRYYVRDELYPTFLHDDDRDMDLFNLIRAPNPTKVKTGSRPCAPHEVPLLTLTAPRVIKTDEPADATDSSGVPSTIERSPLDFAHKAGASDQGTAAPEMPSFEDVPATAAPGAGQAEETATTDPPAPQKDVKEAVMGLILATIQLGLASTVVVPEHAPVGVSDPDSLFFVDASSHHPVDSTLSSPGIAVAGDPKSDNVCSPIEIGPGVRNKKPGSTTGDRGRYEKDRERQECWADQRIRIHACPVLGSLSEERAFVSAVCYPTRAGLRHGVEHGQAQLNVDFIEASDGVSVSVPTVVPQGLALLLADAATQSEFNDT